MVEEHHLFGGLGSAIAEWVVQNKPVKMKLIAFPDENAIHGRSEELFDYYGLNANGIYKSIKDWLK